MRLGKGLGKTHGGAFHRLYAVVKIQNLAAAEQFAPHRLLDQKIIMLEHVGLYGTAVGGRFVQDRHVADAAHRHIECAWNGSGGKGQDIHVLCHCL